MTPHVVLYEVPIHISIELRLSVVQHLNFSINLYSNELLCFFLTDSNNPFYGNRYVKGSDISTRLLFDSSGKLAGIQATVRSLLQLSAYQENLIPSFRSLYGAVPGEARTPSIFFCACENVLLPHRMGLSQSTVRKTMAAVHFTTIHCEPN